MAFANIDACCLIDLLASGHAEAILRATGHAWHVPLAVVDEVEYVRRADPANPGDIALAAVDLSGFVAAGVLEFCQPQTEQEEDLFVRYAALFRSDGEATCLALAASRHWSIATDDRKAIRVAREAGLSVLSCPELVKTWADATQPAATVLTKALDDIECFAQFRPNPRMRAYEWWTSHVGT